jgi:hypothetical protein
MASLHLRHRLMTVLLSLVTLVAAGIPISASPVGPTPVTAGESPPPVGDGPIKRVFR